MHLQQNKCGLVALEAIVGLLILTIVSTTVIQSFGLLIKTASAIEKRKHLAALQAQLISQFDLIMQDVDRHPVSILPLIQRSGSLQYSDGTSLAGISDQFQPASNSDALSYIRVQIESLSKVRIVDQGSMQLTVELCPLFESAPLILLRSILLLGPDGFLEVESEDKQSLHAACKIFYLKPPQKSMVPDADQTLNPQFMTLAVPLEQIYTLYHSSAGQLRLLSHQGDGIIENQPLLSEIDSISLHSSISPGPTLFSLFMRAKWGTEVLELSFSHHIARPPLHDFLFWGARYSANKS